jgi:hypothetical protein
MWFMFIREGSIFDRKNMLLTVINTIILAIGLIVLVAGTYSSIVDIVSFSNAKSFFYYVQVLTVYHRSSLTTTVPLEVSSRASPPSSPRGVWSVYKNIDLLFSPVI